MRRILLVTTMVLLMMSGCAKKTLSTGVDETRADTVYGEGDGTTIYQNVDPNANGVYGMGTTDGNKGIYDNNTAYENGGGGVQNIYFDVDQYSITPEKLAVVSSNANMLRNDIAQGARLTLEGHCDASGTDEYNYALGLRRAKAAKDALIMKGINAGSISLVSMGESSPECTISTSSDCYAKNRRVEFKVVQ